MGITIRLTLCTERQAGQREGRLPADTYLPKETGSKELWLCPIPEPHTCPLGAK